MGLFYRKENPDTELPYRVELGAENTRLVVGLGNTGAKYDLTRHNIGFYCLDRLAEAENATWSLKKALKAQICELRIGRSRVILLKPETFMNNSGESVQAVQKFYKLKNSDMLVVHDELDIKFGQLRTRAGGSSAGNNGIESVIQHCGKDFMRLRIGIANQFSDKTDSADFVLAKFSKDEQASLKLISAETSTLINQFIIDGFLPAQTFKLIG